MTEPRKSNSALFVGRPKWGHGDVRIYHVTPPMPVRDDDPKVATTDYVAVSAVHALTGEETYIFACDGKGEVSDWCELEGSFRGGVDHERALRLAGYGVVA